MKCQNRIFLLGLLIGYFVSNLIRRLICPVHKEMSKNEERQLIISHVMELEIQIIKTIREINIISKENNIQTDHQLSDPKGGIFLDHLGLDEGPLRMILKGSSRDDVMDWGLLDIKRKKDFEVTSPKLHNFALQSAFKDIMINEYRRKHGNRNSHFPPSKYFNNMYVRIVPNYSVQYIVSSTSFSGGKNQLMDRSYVQVAFGPLYIRGKEVWGLGNELDHLQFVGTPEKQRIYFVLPLSGRLRTLKTFLNNYEEVVLKHSENVKLIIIFYGKNKADTLKEVLLIVNNLQKKYSYSGITLKEGETANSKSLALNLAASTCKEDDLIFFIDVDMAFNSETLERVRLFTIKGKQVYYPIVFSEFNQSMVNAPKEGENSDHFVYHLDMGWWRSVGFGMLSIYYSDFKDSKGFDQSIIGWGMEDVLFFDKMIKNGHLNLARIPDPGLVHIYHDKVCEKDLDAKRLNSCKGAAFANFASTWRLWKHISEENPELMQYIKEQSSKKTKFKKSRELTRNKKRVNRFHKLVNNF